MIDWVNSFLQASGQRLINLLARSGGYHIETHAYGAGHRQSLDWYVVDTSLPTVIFFYGGNWRWGKRQDYRFVADTMSQMNVNVMIPDFPLYPEHRFAEILAGAVQATDFFMNEVATETPVLLMGHSSGAQMASLLTLDHTLLESPERIMAMIGLSGPYDFFPFTEDDHWDLFGPAELYPCSQPVNFVQADAPPLYLLHGREDTRVRRGHSKSLMEKQVAAGGVASREVYDGMGHIDAVVSFSRIHRRNSPLIRDIHSYINNLLEEDR